MKQFGFTLILVFFTLCNPLNGQDLNELKSKVKATEALKDTLALARACYKLGQYYEINGQIEESNSSFKKAFFWAKSISSPKAIASITNYLASNYSSVGKIDSSIYYYKVALNASIEFGDSSRIPIVLINLGNEYSNLGDYATAANYSISAIRIKEILKDSVNLAYFYQKVGELYKTAGEKEKWKEYIEKAYKLIHNENYANTEAVAAVYNDLGGIAENHENYEQALLYYDSLISFGRNNNYPQAIGVALTNSAAIYKQQGNLDKALNTAIEATKYNSAEGYQDIYDYNLLAELYFAKNNNTEALKNALLAINHKSINNYLDEKMRAFKILYQIEKANRNFENALFWNENFKLLSDSLRNKDIRTQIMDLEIGYETEKKEQQIELLTTENKLKSQRLNTGIAIVAFLLLVIFLISYILRIRKKQAELVQNNLQQQVLRAQMNPHFIFNVLGSIQNFMMGNNSKKAAGYLSKFASLTRATLEYSSEESIPLSDEIAMLQNYMELEQMRKPGRFEFEIKYDNELESDFIQIPPMLIQPFIENAIKHGLKKMESGGFLKIQITDKTDWIEFIIDDNGEGIQKSNTKQKNHKSMAMEIFEKRRKLIQQKHKKDFGFELQNIQDINPNQSGVRIRIDVPVIEN